MTKQLKDLVRSITEMSGEDVTAKIRQVRHNKMVAKPAAQKRARKAAQNKEKQNDG